MGSQDRRDPIIDNPLRYSQPGPRSLPITPLPAPCRCDSMAIMHVLEQIKTELRTVASEVAALEAEVINIRRQMAPAQPWRR